MDARIVFVTCPGEHAEQLARAMVETRLAACVTILSDVQSIYRWEGKVTADRESVLMVKTSAAKIDAISIYVKEHHPYDLPEFVVIAPTQVEAGYLDWLMQSVAP